YAIFSYRWLPVGEVNFEDLTSASYQREGQGWEKLLGFCKTARGLGYELAWADTCCIDKHSNVELDEAIRSMFQWYRYSGICIVYLARTASLGDFEQDAWCTRGLDSTGVTGSPNDKGISVILHSIDTTHSSDIAKVWTTVSSKALKLFNKIPIQDRLHWWFGCRRLNCSLIELLESTTTEWHPRKVVPEFRRCLEALLRSLSAFGRRISRRRGLNCPLSFAILRFRFLSRRHHGLWQI
ncbi:hypothetical protein K469DRAFT_546007, partial [Zopfia rhizophila CBS 207.26]